MPSSGGSLRTKRRPQVPKQPGGCASGLPMCPCLLSAARRPCAWRGAVARTSLLTRRTDIPTARARGGRATFSLWSHLAHSTCSPSLTSARSWGPVWPPCAHAGRCPPSLLSLSEGGGQEGRRGEGRGSLPQRVSLPHTTQAALPRPEGRGGVRPGLGAWTHGAPSEDPRGDAHGLPWAGCRSGVLRHRPLLGAVRGPETALGWGWGGTPGLAGGRGAR